MDGVGEPKPVNDGVGLVEAVLVVLGEGEGVADGSVVGEALGEGEALPDGDGVGPGIAVLVDVGDPEPVEVTVGEGIVD